MALTVPEEVTADSASETEEPMSVLTKNPVVIFGDIADDTTLPILLVALTTEGVAPTSVADEIASVTLALAITEVSVDMSRADNALLLTFASADSSPEEAVVSTPVTEVGATSVVELTSPGTIVGLMLELAETAVSTSAKDSPPVRILIG